MPLNFKRTRDLLYDFQFHQLFIEELGWYQPSTKKAVSLEVEEKRYQSEGVTSSSKAWQTKHFPPQASKR